MNKTALIAAIDQARAAIDELERRLGATLHEPRKAYSERTSSVTRSTPRCGACRRPSMPQA